MSLELNTLARDRALGASINGNVSHEPWTAPAKCTRGNSIARDPATGWKYPIFDAGGKLSAKGVNVMLGQVEKESPEMMDALSAISTAIKANATSSASYFVVPGAHLSAIDNEPKVIGRENASYFWKELMCAGNWVHPRTKQPIDVDSSRLNHWAKSGNEMIAAGIPIPVNIDHGFSALDTVGYVVHFKVDDGKLMGKLQMIGDDAATLLARNFTSVGIFKTNMFDGSTRTWPDVILHVAVTQYPVVPGLDQPIAASGLAGAAANVFVPANNFGPLPEKDKAMDNMIPCSAECLSAIRSQSHLNLSGVSDANLMSELAKFHTKHAQNLSTIRRDVPGLDESPNGEELSRLSQHLSTMKQVREKLSPSHAAAHLSVIEQGALLMGRVDELSNASKTLEAKEATITAQQGQITELSKKVVKEVDPTAATFLSALVKAKCDGMIDKKILAPHVAKALHKLVIDGDKVNTLLCSANANPYSSNPVILDILEILSGNGPTPAMGMDTAGQNLGYMPAGQNVDSEATKKMMEDMKAQAAGKSTVA